jgi:hypothetical protein
VGDGVVGEGEDKLPSSLVLLAWGLGWTVGPCLGCVDWGEDWGTRWGYWRRDAPAAAAFAAFEDAEPIVMFYYIASYY